MQSVGNCDTDAAVALAEFAGKELILLQRDNPAVTKPVPALSQETPSTPTLQSLNVCLFSTTFISSNVCYTSRIARKVEMEPRFFARAQGLALDLDENCNAQNATVKEM